MVDSIGVNRMAAVDTVRLSTVTAQPAASSGAAQTATAQAAPVTATSESIALSKQLASAPPVNAARVAEIRKAIADGTFPILPATIADRMLALKMDWTTHDQA